jgi:hypothetical protein
MTSILNIFIIIIFSFFLTILLTFFYQSATNNNITVDWTNIDVVYYINIDNRTDRKREFLSEMAKVGMPSEKIVRIPAVYDKDRGALGCTKSHIKTLELFIKSQHKNCIIFEDDFDFENVDKVKSQFNDFFNSHIIFDVVMLSANLIRAETTNYNGLYKVIDAQTTSGYMLSKEFATILLENYKKGSYLLEISYKENVGKTPKYEGKYAVDQYWKLLQPSHKWYIFNPKIGKQRKSYSDIENGVVFSGA